MSMLPNRGREVVDFTNAVSRTQQQFKEECDINSILGKFRRTGVIDHVNRYNGDYGFATSTSFQEAMNQVAEVNSMFASLPSEIRNRFANDAGAFLEFVQDPANAGDVEELGLVPGVEPGRRGEQQEEESSSPAEPGAEGAEAGEAGSLTPPTSKDGE